MGIKKLNKHYFKCKKRERERERELTLNSRGRSRGELDSCFNCCIKNFKENLKPLSGVSKSQVGECVVATNQRKK